MFELTYWFCRFGAEPVLSCIAQFTRSTACPQTEPRRFSRPPGSRASG
jgi:hypothetical protein